MRETKVYCDKCKNEIKGLRIVVDVDDFLWMRGEHSDDKYRKDLCQKCAKLLKEFFEEEK